MKRLLLTVMALLTFNLAHADTPEKLMGFKMDPTGIEFQVFTGGCTSKNSFRLGLAESMPIQMTLVRVKPDFCEAFIPYGTTVKYTWEELGFGSGTAFVLKNPLLDPFYVY